MVPTVLGMVWVRLILGSRLTSVRRSCLPRYSSGLLAPCLELVLPPGGEVVHVREQLFPGHDAGSRIWGHEGWACCALGIRANLLAHVLAQVCKLVLYLGT